ncbi:MAG: hypothetical protein U9P00_08885 [Pseudomonadota bacterium]|nr:hypothetical protein [Pseudomonadota bacterium]
MSDTLIGLLNEIIDTAERQGMNQAQLVEQAGLGEVTLSRAKKAGDLRYSTLERLAKAVGLRVTLSPDVPMARKIETGELFK